MAQAERNELAPIPVEPMVPMATGIALVIERFASNPAVDMAKLEKMIELQERILAHEARAAFAAAFSRLQGELPTILERGRTDKGKYAPLEDIVKAVRPVLCRHGFSISHRTEWLENGKVRVVGVLRHLQGHEETSTFETPPDTSGSKNGVQALGSANSYGRRYTTKDLLNIVTTDEDDDGQNAGKSHVPDPPEGWQQWADNMTAVADEGRQRLQECWDASPNPLREYAVKYRESLVKGWQRKAKAASGGNRG